MTPEPDFLRPTRRPHRLAWLACGTACLVLLVAALDAEQARQALAEAQTPAPLPRRPVAPPPTAADTAAQRAVQQALDRLGRPWPEAFRSIEVIRLPGLAWLAVSIDDAGALQLEGQAPDAATALSAARLLRQQPAWRDVVLGRMERTVDGPLQFEIRAAAGGMP